MSRPSRVLRDRAAGFSTMPGRLHRALSPLRRLLLPVLGATVAAVAAAQSESGGTGTWSGRAEVVTSFEQIRARAGSALARVGGLPDSTTALELRPEVTWETARLSVTAKPRAVIIAAGGERTVSTELNEGWVRLRPRSGLSLQAGREVLLWGPAMFWNPSNPFFAENNRDNPQRELGGIDLVRARWQISRAWSATAISQFGRGRAAVDAAHRNGVKFDWIGDSASAGLIAAAAPGQRASVHGWTQATVSNALILYGEFGWSEGADTVRPEPGATPTGWLLLPTPAGGRSVKAIAGGAYTLLSGVTVTLEVWRNGDAWDADRRGTVATALGALVRRPYGMADGQIGSLLTTPPDPYGRHRAGAQLMNAGEGRTSWLVRYTHGLDEGGGEWLGYLRRDLGDSLRVWGSAAWRSGSDRSGYGLGIRSAVTVGFTWMPW